MGNTNDRGMGWVDLYVRPHYGSPDFPKAREEYIKEAAKTVSGPIYAIDDQTAIEVVEGKVKVISEGKYLVFR